MPGVRLSRMVAGLGVTLACQLLVSALWAAPPVVGKGQSAAGPRAAAGTRKLPSPSSAAAAKSAAEPTKPTPAPLSYQRGRPPKAPSPRLPEGFAPPEPDNAARRRIAEGPTSDDLRAGANEPELNALRDAERVLFPRPLPGARSGWSWLDVAREPRVRADGLPGSLQPIASEEPRSAAADDAPRPAAEVAWLKSLVMPDLPVVFTSQVVKYLLFYRDDARGRLLARAWVKKSGRHAAAIQAELTRAALPTDLVWLSLIESGHNADAKSTAGAAGLWQFIPESARAYGLVVDRWVDERLDPIRSTQAAVRYLDDLHKRFGTWDLAMAAYNMGHGGLTRAIRKYNTNDFWALCRFEAGIPWETTLYVPKILAIAVMMNNRRAFGLDDVTADAPLAFDSVTAAPGTALSRVASAASVPLDAVQRLNRALLLERVPPAPGPRQVVRLPRGSGERASRALAGNDAQGALGRYRVRFGDTVAAIASQFGSDEAALRTLNSIADNEVLRADTILLLPAGTASSAKPASQDQVVVAAAREKTPPHARRVFYRVLGGETLSLVAQAFNVNVGDVAVWNAVDPDARLVAGMVLQLFVHRTQPLDNVRYIADEDARVLVPGTTSFYEYFENLNGNTRLVVRAAPGDTLAAIAKRYGMTIGSLERVNRRSREDELVSGESVVVYSKQAGEVPSAAPAPRALPPVQAPRPDALPPVLKPTAQR